MDANTHLEAPPRVVALGVDGEQRARLEAAVVRLGASLRIAAADGSLGDADVIVVGDAHGAGSAPVRQARDAGAASVLLMVDVDDDERVRLAVEGIDVVAPTWGAAALAARLALHAHAARAAASRGARAEALLRVNEGLVASLVHDLRTPLMAINLSAEVAAARSGEEPVHQAVRRIRSSTQRMARALDHLVNLSRVDANPLVGTLAPVDVGQAVQRVVEAARAERGVPVDLALQGELVARVDVAALGGAIRHMLDTLLDHAGSERVSVRVDGSSSVRIWFELATPAVVSPEAQEALMGPAREREGREQPGLALGLHAIEGVVRAHAGSVVGRSKAPEGTVFELLLPRDPRGA